MQFQVITFKVMHCKLLALLSELSNEAEFPKELWYLKSIGPQAPEKLG